MRFSSPTKDVKFCGQTVKINKLSGASVFNIQDMTENLRKSSNPEDPKANMEIMYATVRAGCVEFKDISTEDMDTLPTSEISELCNEILSFSGMGVGK